MRTAICLLLVSIIGCSESGREVIPITTASVTGTATYNGKPLENYRVFFYCATDGANEPATDRIKADGTFTLSVRTPGDGAIVGTNNIWFSYDPPLPEEIPGMEQGVAPPPASVKIPEKFLARETSGLTVEVPESGLDNYILELK